jgi:hypothetical protein
MRCAPKMMRMNRKNVIGLLSPKLGAKKMSKRGATHPIIIQK